MTQDENAPDSLASSDRRLDVTTPARSAGAVHSPIISRSASYGYEIVTTLAELGPIAAGENTVYPLLRRLKADGDLETFMKDSASGPPRQYYRLTSEGRRRLSLLEREWEAMALAVDKCRHIEKETP